MRGSNTIETRGVRSRVFLFLGTGLGVGFIPGPKGTYGTLLTAAIYGLFLRNLSPAAHLIIVFLLLAASIWIAHEAGKSFKSDDPREIVIDEVIGFYISMLFLPQDWSTIVAAAFFFRVHDIYKTWPAKPLDKELPGAWGVVVDDVVAGIYANLSVRLLLWVTGLF